MDVNVCILYRNLFIRLTHVKTAHPNGLAPFTTKSDVTKGLKRWDRSSSELKQKRKVFGVVSCSFENSVKCEIII
jgi:hypothetical protein